MKHELDLPSQHRKASLVVLSAALSCLLLLAGWFAAQAGQAPQLREQQFEPSRPPTSLPPSVASASTVSNAAVTSTAHLPLVVQTLGQTVTLIAPQAEWSAAWWSWVERTNGVPIQQHGSVDCELGQSGEVWFLAGTEGYTATVRTCTVPANQTLMVPIHTISWNNTESENLTVPEKRAVLAAVYSDQEPGLLNTKICRVESNINGEAVANVRLESPPFPLSGDPEAVADGFWFAFSLSSGIYVVEFRGTLCDFATDAPVNDVDVTYTLQVDPPGASQAER